MTDLHDFCCDEVDEIEKLRFEMFTEMDVLYSVLNDDIEAIRNDISNPFGTVIIFAAIFLVGLVFGRVL